MLTPMLTTLLLTPRMIHIQFHTHIIYAHITHVIYAHIIGPALLTTEWTCPCYADADNVCPRAVGDVEISIFVKSYFELSNFKKKLFWTEQFRWKLFWTEQFQTKLFWTEQAHTYTWWQSGDAVGSPELLRSGSQFSPGGSSSSKNTWGVQVI